MRTISLKVAPIHNGAKAATVLRSFGVSAALLTKLKKTETGITLNGKPIRSIERVNEGDALTISIEDSGTPPAPWAIPINICYEDEDIIIVNKPAGMAVHETRNHQGDALSNAVSAACSLSGAFRPVFRLDRDTSGLVLIAKHELSAAKLAGKIKKDYYAAVSGEFSGSGTIDAPIARASDSIMLRCVSPEGERAVTHWQALCTNGEFSLLKIKLETGRTHQIRVHFASVGAPLLGDTLYGGDCNLISRQALHCKRIEFTHPVTNVIMEMECPFPEDFKGLISCLPTAPTIFSPAK